MHLKAFCNQVFIRKLITKSNSASNKFRKSGQIFRIMKLVAFLLIVAIHVNAKGLSQITLSEKNAPLEKIFQLIEKQSGYVFFYDYAWLQQSKSVSIKIKKASLTEVLTTCFKDQPLTYSIVGKTVVVKPKDEIINEKSIIPAIQEVIKNMDISGTVTDSASGLPLGGASVKLKGTDIGTATNANGQFSLQVPDAGGVLVISYVGYETKEVTVSRAGSLKITLQQKETKIDEIVVIGYGTRQKKDVTGAISQVTSKDIEKSTAMTPELALQGRAPGIFVESGGGQPAARPTIRIRGSNTFGYSDPLYVIDGVPVYEGGSGVTGGAIGDIRSPINIFSLINPNDIESINVLKDASSAAIYGVRASNGVILITTKKGKAGRPRVDVSTSYGIQNIPESKDVLNTQQYFGLIQEAYANFPDAGVSFGEKFGPLYNSDSSQYVGNGPTYDWQNELLNKNAKIQDYNVKVSGGNENLTYYFSGGYSKTESPLKANHLDRYSFSSNVDSKIFKYLQAGLNIRLIQSHALDNTNGSLNDMMSTVPFQPCYDHNDPTGFAATGTGNIVPHPADDPTALSPGAPFILENSRLLWGEQTRYNAFALQALNKRSFNLLNALGRAYVQLEPFAGFKIKGTLSGNYFFNFRTEFSNNESWRFTQPPGAPFGTTQNEFAKGSLGERNTRTTNLNKELTINYNHTFYNDHNIDVILGASEQFARWHVSDLSGQVDYVDPQYWGITNRPPNVNGFSGILQEDDLIGYVGRISYKYKDKYYFDGTMRRDGSSRLAPGQKFGNFPSFALAWRISAEDFFPKTTFINDLKLRGGWGKLGNFQSAGYYEYLTTVLGSPDYSLGSGNGNGVGIIYNAVALPGFANTTLTWEKIKETSFGFDASLFSNRVSLTAEYYNKITYDVIQSVSLPPNTGIQNAADLNVAQVRNRGIEIQLGYNQKFGEVNVNFAGNITTVSNKVTKLNGGTPIGGEGGRIEEGYSMFYLWGYKVGGVFQTQEEINEWRQSHTDENIGQVMGDLSQGYQYQPGDMYFQDVYGNPKDPKERYSPIPDSLINGNDRTYLGKTIPGYFYGFSFGADYKGFDLSIFFQGVGDVQRYNYTRAGLEAMGGLANQWATTLNRWTVNNKSTSMPRAVWGDPASSTRFSSRFVEDAGYLRLKNLQIGYSLPKTLLGKLGFIQNFRIYASAVNLFTITNWTGLDPEADSGGGVNGINVVPPTRQFLFGVNATF
jgi:TonB-linked SusC/RagA family outer membrane protein